jgi:RNA polymerase sigma-B factor
MLSSATAALGTGGSASARVGRLETDEQLLRRYQDGEVRARDELVYRFMPLTRRLAGRYRHTGEAQDDLEQVACMGLIKAVDRYDPELGPFVRYAVPNVMGELKRHFRDKGWGMHVPRSVQERFLQVNDAMDQLSGRLGRSPSPRDIAEHTGLAVEEVLEALDAATAYSPITLDAPHPGDGDTERTLADSLGAEDPSYGFVDLGQALAPAFRALPPREQLILKLRFIDDLTQSEIAERVGVSQMHVSRLLRRSLDRLNAAAEGQSQPDE